MVSSTMDPSTEETPTGVTLEEAVVQFTSTSPALNESISDEPPVTSFSDVAQESTVLPATTNYQTGRHETNEFTTETYYDTTINSSLNETHYETADASTVAPDSVSTHNLLTDHFNFTEPIHSALDITSISPTLASPTLASPTLTSPTLTSPTLTTVTTIALHSSTSADLNASTVTTEASAAVTTLEHECTESSPCPDANSHCVSVDGRNVCECQIAYIKDTAGKCQSHSTATITSPTTSTSTSLDHFQTSPTSEILVPPSPSPSQTPKAEVSIYP